MKLRLSQRGDTLIEVLIALAILGLVLSISFVSASRSLRGAQNSQERGEALKVAETQLEYLKTIASSTPSVFAGSWFCIGKNPATSALSTVNLTGIPGDLAAHNIAIYPSGPGQCLKPARYYTGMHYDSSRSTFELIVRWDRLGGGKDEVRMFYGLTQASATVAVASLPPGPPPSPTPPPPGPTPTPPPPGPTPPPPACTSPTFTFNPNIYKIGAGVVGSVRYEYTVPIDSTPVQACTYTITVSTVDVSHPSSSPTPQDYESLFVEGYTSCGLPRTRTFITPGVTDDFPNDSPGTTTSFTGVKVDNTTRCLMLKHVSRYPGDTSISEPAASQWSAPYWNQNSLELDLIVFTPTGPL